MGFFKEYETVFLIRKLKNTIVFWHHTITFIVGVGKWNMYTISCLGEILIEEVVLGEETDADAPPVPSYARKRRRKYAGVDDLVDEFPDPDEVDEIEDQPQAEDEDEDTRAGIYETGYLYMKMWLPVYENVFYWDESVYI